MDSAKSGPEYDDKRTRRQSNVNGGGVEPSDGRIAFDAEGSRDKTTERASPRRVLAESSISPTFIGDGRGDDSILSSGWDRESGQVRLTGNVGELSI